MASLNDLPICSPKKLPTLTRTNNYRKTENIPPIIHFWKQSPPSSPIHNKYDKYAFRNSVTTTLNESLLENIHIINNKDDSNSQTSPNSTNIAKNKQINFSRFFVKGKLFQKE